MSVSHILGFLSLLWKFYPGPNVQKEVQYNARSNKFL